MVVKKNVNVFSGTQVDGIFQGSTEHERIDITACGEIVDIDRQGIAFREILDGFRKCNAVSGVASESVGKFDND